MGKHIMVQLYWLKVFYSCVSSQCAFCGNTPSIGVIWTSLQYMFSSHLVSLPWPPQSGFAGPQDVEGRTAAAAARCLSASESSSSHLFFEPVHREEWAQGKVNLWPQLSPEPSHRLNPPLPRHVAWRSCSSAVTPVRAAQWHTGFLMLLWDRPLA